MSILIKCLPNQPNVDVSGCCQTYCKLPDLTGYEPPKGTLDTWAADHDTLLIRVSLTNLVALGTHCAHNFYIPIKSHGGELVAQRRVVTSKGAAQTTNFECVRPKRSVIRAMYPTAKDLPEIAMVSFFSSRMPCGFVVYERVKRYAHILEGGTKGSSKVFVDDNNVSTFRLDFDPVESAVTATIDIYADSTIYVYPPALTYVCVNLYIEHTFLK